MYVHNMESSSNLAHTYMHSRLYVKIISPNYPSSKNFNKQELGGVVRASYLITTVSSHWHLFIFHFRLNKIYGRGGCTLNRYTKTCIVVLRCTLD